MLETLAKIVITFGNICAILLLIGSIFLCITCYVMLKDEKSYADAVKELEESEGDTYGTDIE
jgi:hypothetical protein